MDKNYKILVENDSKSVIEKNNEFNVISHYTEVAVLPYSINNSGILDKVGVIGYVNFYNNISHLTIPSSYRKNTDASCMITANRILYEYTNVNIDNASKWMYLGDIYNKYSGTPIKVYCVDISDCNAIKKSELNMIDIGTAITSDDSLLLASYLRLFKLYYTQDVDKNK